MFFRVYTYYYTNVESGKCENKKVKHCLNYSLQFFLDIISSTTKTMNFNVTILLCSINEGNLLTSLNIRICFYNELSFKNKLVPKKINYDD